MEGPVQNLTLSPNVEEQLHTAIRDRNSDAFERIAQENHLDFNYSFKHVPPLIALIQHLVQENFVPAVEMILLRRNLCSAESRAFRTAFMYAYIHELVEIVSLYIRAVLEHSIHCISLEESFDFAVDKQLYELALEVSRDPEFLLNVIPPNRRPPLHVAVLNGQASMVEDFLNRGAIVDAKDYRGDTPLLLGCSLKSFDCCRVLLTHGADPNYKNPSRFDRSAFTAICTSPVSSRFPEKSTLQLLLLLQMFGLRPQKIVGTHPGIGNVMMDNGGTHPGIGIVMMDTGDQELQLVERLQKSQVYQAPSSLQVECCRLIRSHLMHVHRGLSVLKYIDYLPLPSFIIWRHFKCDLA